MSIEGKKNQTFGRMDLPVTVQFDTKYYKLENDQWKEYYEII